VSTQEDSVVYVLESEVSLENKVWRITRIVHDDESLFQDKQGNTYITKESYLQLHSEEGRVHHHVLSSERREYDGPRSSIKGLPALPWRQT
jgi:hypothetical protein